VTVILLEILITLLHNAILDLACSCNAFFLDWASTEAAAPFLARILDCHLFACPRRMSLADALAWKIPVWLASC
jgi:hypothetical protein